MATYENLTIEKDQDVALVTFNRPEKANALNQAHLREIEAVALSFRDDPTTRVVIFTGVGKHFSSGADLTAGGGKPQRRDRAIVARATGCESQIGNTSYAIDPSLPIIRSHPMLTRHMPVGDIHDRLLVRSGYPRSRNFRDPAATPYHLRSHRLRIPKSSFSRKEMEWK